MGTHPGHWAPPAKPPAKPYFRQKPRKSGRLAGFGLPSGAGTGQPAAACPMARAGGCQISLILLEPSGPRQRPIHEPIACDANDFGRGSDRKDRRRRPARHAGAVRTAPCTGVPVRAAAGAQRGDGGGLDQRGVPRRLAASRKVRGPLGRLDLDVEYRALQGPVGAAAPAGSRNWTTRRRSGSRISPTIRKPLWRKRTRARSCGNA